MQVSWWRMERENEEAEGDSSRLVVVVCLDGTGITIPEPQHTDMKNGSFNFYTHGLTTNQRNTYTHTYPVNLICMTASNLAK